MSRKTLQDLPNELLEQIIMQLDSESFSESCMINNKKFASFCQRYEKELLCYREIKRRSGIKFYGTFKDIKHIVCDIHDLVVSSGVWRNHQGYFEYAAELGLLHIVKFFYNQGGISKGAVDFVVNRSIRRQELEPVVEYLLKLDVCKKTTLYNVLVGTSNFKLFKLAIKYLLKNKDLVFYTERDNLLLNRALGHSLAKAFNLGNFEIAGYIFDNFEINAETAEIDDVIRFLEASTGRPRVPRRRSSASSVASWTGMFHE